MTSRIVTELRQLHVRAGRPSSRQVATKSGGGTSHSTVLRVMNGEGGVSLDVLLAVVRGLDGDEDFFTELWELEYALDSGPAPLLQGHGTLATELRAMREALERIEKRLDGCVTSSDR